MATSEEIFQDAVALPLDVRAELTERLIASLAENVSPEVTVAQLAEVRRRIADVESEEVALIPGDDVLARVYWREYDVYWRSTRLRVSRASHCCSPALPEL